MLKRCLTALLLLAAVAALPGPAAAKDYKKAMVGTWEVDLLEMMKQSEEMANLPEEMDLSAMFKDSYIRLTFDKDGSYRVAGKIMMGEQLETGSWEIVETKDDVVTIKTTTDEGEEKTVSVVFKDDDTFQAEMEGEEGKMTAHRVEPDERDKKPKSD